LLIAPAITALVLTMGSEIYLQISVIGPLTVVPLFVTSRLLGRVLDLRRKSLGRLLDMPSLIATQQMKTVKEHQTGRPVRQARQKARRPRLDAPRHPEAAEQPSWKPRPVAAQAAPQAADPFQTASQEIFGEEPPDLTKLPGACVFTGKDRENAGAASDMNQSHR